MAVLDPRRRLAAASVVLLSLAPPLGAATRPITETDLFRFTWIADPQISPDGRRVAFVRVTVDAKKTGYETAIWTVDTDGSHPPRSFTAGPQDLAPRWSPDGTRLAFTRAVEKAGAVSSNSPDVTCRGAGLSPPSATATVQTCAGRAGSRKPRPLLR